MSPLTTTEKTLYFDYLQEAIDFISLAVDNNKSDKQVREMIGGLSKTIVSNLKWNTESAERIEDILWNIYWETKLL